MGKDRFSNQKKENYSKEFRWGNASYTPSVKCNLVFTKPQRIFIRDFLVKYKEQLNSWETDFLIVLNNSAMYSERQKDTLLKIVKNIKKLNKC
jgi:hypothetical protein